MYTQASQMSFYSDTSLLWLHVFLSTVWEDKGEDRHWDLSFFLSGQPDLRRKSLEEFQLTLSCVWVLKDGTVKKRVKAMRLYLHLKSFTKLVLIKASSSLVYRPWIYFSYYFCLTFLPITNTLPLVCREKVTAWGWEDIGPSWHLHPSAFLGPPCTR